MALETVTGSDFNYPFRFESVVKAANNSGGQDESYSKFVNTRGLWIKKDGARGLVDGFDKMITMYDAYCYWRSDLESFITKGTRLIYDNKSYKIESYERIGERRQYMHFNVTEFH